MERDLTAWERIVGLARELDRNVADACEIDADGVLLLSRAILAFESAIHGTGGGDPLAVTDDAK